MDSALSLDVLEKIQETAVFASGHDVAQRVVTKPIPEDPASYLVIDKDGIHTVVERPQPKRSHKLLSCADVVLFAKWLSGQSDGEVNASPIIWVSPSAIIVTDDNDRLRGNCAAYTLQFTDLWTAVNHLGKGPQNDGSYDQSEFLKLLRVVLARAFATNEQRLSLVANVRQLKKQAASNIGQGSGSYEAGILDQANNLISWPDSLLLNTTVFEDVSLKGAWKVEVSLDVRPENSGRPFFLSPIPADLAAAKQAALDAACDLIRTQIGDIPVFMGSPS